MKIISKSIRILLLVISMVLFSCKDNSTNADLGKTTTVIIQISLADENPYLLDVKSGVSLSLEGTSFVATTDSLGYAILKGVPFGIHNIVASYPGYVTTKWLNFNFETDTMRTFLSISKLPRFNVKTLNIITNKDSIYFSGQISDVANYERLVTIYFGKDSTVSNENWQFGLGKYVKPMDSTFQLSDFGVSLKLNGFPTSGMKVYVAAYGMGGGSYIFNSQSTHPYRMDVSEIVYKSNFLMP